MTTQLMATARIFASHFSEWASATRKDAARGAAASSRPTGRMRALMASCASLRETSLLISPASFSRGGEAGRFFEGDA